ncbi:hypothetical protein SAMN06272735_8319 [Streptomyces sp. TLI_55]|nr:hypothetical protein SAMN06272735_8319 [Streptomyces sp. TLI_55]
MKVVIAGAMGRIGSRAVIRLRKDGTQVLPFSRHARSRPTTSPPHSPTSPAGCRCSASWRPLASRSERSSTSPPTTARPLIGEAQTPFFGALIGERTPLPGPDAHSGRHTMAQPLKDR